MSKSAPSVTGPADESDTPPRSPLGNLECPACWNDDPRYFRIFLGRWASVLTLEDDPDIEIEPPPDEAAVICTAPYESKGGETIPHCNQVHTLGELRAKAKLDRMEKSDG